MSQNEMVQSAETRNSETALGKNFFTSNQEAKRGSNTSAGQSMPRTNTNMHQFFAKFNNGKSFGTQGM